MIRKSIVRNLYKSGEKGTLFTYYIDNLPKNMNHNILYLPFERMINKNKFYTELHPNNAKEFRLLTEWTRMIPNTFTLYLEERTNNQTIQALFPLNKKYNYLLVIEDPDIKLLGSLYNKYDNLSLVNLSIPLDELN